MFVWKTTANIIDKCDRQWNMLREIREHLEVLGSNRVLSAADQADLLNEIKSLCLEYDSSCSEYDRLIGKHNVFLCCKKFFCCLISEDVFCIVIKHLMHIIEKEVASLPGASIILSYRASIESDESALSQDNTAATRSSRQMKFSLLCAEMSLLLFPIFFALNFL